MKFILAGVLVVTLILGVVFLSEDVGAAVMMFRVMVFAAWFVISLVW